MSTDREQERGSLTLPDLLAALSLVTALALLAIALSGLAALAFGQFFGETFVAGDPSGTEYATWQCQAFQAGEADASSCYAAATARHFDDLVSDRLTTAIPGLLLLGAYRLIRRGQAWASPRVPRFILAVAPPCFSLAAFILIAFGIMQLAYSGSEGTGGDFAGGVVAALAALVAAQWEGASSRRSAELEGSQGSRGF